MNNMTLVSIWGNQTNPSYNTTTCNNGGGYFQFAGGALFALPNGHLFVDVQDTSCGDFGSRVNIMVDAPEHRWIINAGSMDDTSMDSEEIDGILRSISGILGVKAEDWLVGIYESAAEIAADF